MDLDRPLQAQPIKTFYGASSQICCKQPSQILKCKFWNLIKLVSSLTVLSAQIQHFVEALFAHNTDLAKFKLILRDFLIQLKEFSGDNSELFAEDREDAQKAAQVAERERAIKVGGLLKPAEIDQDDEL